MSTVIDDRVMYRMFTAENASAINRQATGARTAAKLRGDDARANRALSVAGSYGNESMTAVEKAREALLERLEELRAEQARQLEEQLEKQRQAAEEEEQGYAVSQTEKPAVTVELSGGNATAVPAERDTDPGFSLYSAFAGQSDTGTARQPTSPFPDFALSKIGVKDKY